MFIIPTTKNRYINTPSSFAIHIAAILTSEQWEDIELSVQTTWEDIKEVIARARRVGYMKDVCLPEDKSKYDKLSDELEFYEALLRIKEVSEKDKVMAASFSKLKLMLNIRRALKEDVDG